MGEKRKKLYIGIILATAALLAALCVLMWDVSDAASGARANGGRLFPVYLNEIMPSNSRYPNADGLCCDYIELYNNADYTVLLSGYQLSDGGSSKRFVFPEGASIGPGSYLVIYCGQGAGDCYAEFGISRAGGETIRFLTPKGVVIDSVATQAVAANESMILTENGWQVTAACSPGQSNDRPVTAFTANSAVSPVRLNELMADNGVCPDPNGEYRDWVELYNSSDTAVDVSGYTLSDNVNTAKFTLPQGTRIEAGGYLVIYCDGTDGSGQSAPFGLSKYGGETVVLKNEDGRVADLVETVATAENTVMAVSGGGWITLPYGTPGFENSEAGREAYLNSLGCGAGNVVISELMPANAATLCDAFRQFSDWVELENTGSQAVELEGWFLSDDSADPMKWEFPACRMEPGARLVVFCSGRDTVEGGELHTSFSLASAGEELVLTDPMGVAEDSVRYGSVQADRSLVRDRADGSLAETDYPTPGSANDAGGYEAFCAARTAAGPLAIWEVMTSNDLYMPQDGQCYDWVELRNLSGQAVELSDYALTDSADHPDQFRLPARQLAPGESVTVLLSGDSSLSSGDRIHGNFALNAALDRLYLYDGQGVLLDYVLLRDIPNGYSYGRSAESGGFFYMEPTPEQDNRPGWRMISDAPESDMAAGVHTLDSGLEVALSAPGNIYYTTDGSVPGAGSQPYTGPVRIDSTTVLRAVAIEDGRLQSDIYTACFIIGEPHAIPIVSLVTDPGNLKGPNAIYADNWETKEEKRSANISYTGGDGSFSLDCEISMHGMTSLLVSPKKSFTVRFRNNYDGPLRYDIFGDGRVTTFNSIILRADVESVYSSFLRDNLFGYLGSYYSDAMLAQNTKYVALYLNGQYWGIYSIREHYSEAMYAAHMGFPTDTVTMAKNYMLPDSSLFAVRQFCVDNSLAPQENYDYVCSVIDVDSFIDWTIFEAYTGNFDINGNMRYFYSTVDGLWRCGLTDVDLGMFTDGTFSEVIDTLQHGEIIESLFENQAFQDRMLRRMAELLNGPMSDENMAATIDMLAARIRDEIPLERERWGGTADQWERMVDDLKRFCTGRSQVLIDDIQDRFHMSRDEIDRYFGGQT